MAVITISGYDVLVDDEDVSRISEHTWHLAKHKRNLEFGLYYFKTNVPYPTMENKRCVLALHRFIAGTQIGDGTVVDHIDRNTVNNTKANLRVVTQSENARNRKVRIDNSTGFKGISYIKKKDKYVVAYMVKGILREYGSYRNLEDAKIVAKYVQTTFLNDLYIDIPEIVWGNLPDCLSEDGKAVIDALMDRRARGVRNTNQSGHRGVCWNIRRQRWIAQLYHNEVKLWIGAFLSKEEAIAAYIETEKRLKPERWSPPNDTWERIY